MLLFVLAYPVFDPAAASAIEAFRRRHEPERAALVAAHVTLVFGVTGVAIDGLKAEAVAIAETERPFAFALESAEPFQGEGEAKLLLRAGRGEDRFRRLHARLHAGILAPHLRTDLPFVPHMTIATVRPPATLEAARADTGRPHLPLPGRIDSLSIAALDGAVLHDVARLPLTG